MPSSYDNLETTIDLLSQRVDSMSHQLKASEEKEHEAQYDEEKKEARKAALLQAMQDMTPEEKKAMRSRIKASDDEDMKKAMDEIHEEKKEAKKGSDDDDDEHTASKKGNNHDKVVEKLEARVKELSATVEGYQAERFESMINELATLKASIIPNLNIDIYKTKLQGKSF